MTACSPSPVIPVVSMQRRVSIAARWPATDRAALARKLEALGINLTEASDARELASRPRLSESTPEQRRLSPLWFMGAIGQGWLAVARERRAMLTDALASCDRNAVATARHLLGLRSASPSSWRLGELAATYAQSRILETTR